MAHLRQRLCLVPFTELTDCPEGKHHAIGSPYFDAIGKPLFPDPVVIVVKADIADESLPRCTYIAASCNTRPYHSYGPVMRRIIEQSQPHNYPEVRRSMEGVIEVGDVKELPPGGLSNQTDMIMIGCVASMTSGSNPQNVQTVLHNFCRAFQKTKPGSTLRMPLIGTGTARTEEAVDKLFREVTHYTIAQLLPALLPEDIHQMPRKLLIIHPLEYESSLIAKMVEEKAVFLSLLDKMGMPSTDPRLVYGLAHGTLSQHQFVEESNFAQALDYFDQALNQLLNNNRKLAMQLAAQAVQIEPNLSGMYLYMNSLIMQKAGLWDAIVHEAASLAAQGRIQDAYWVGQCLEILGAKSKNMLAFEQCLKNCYLDVCTAAIESRILYENYMQAKEMLDGILRSTSATSSASVALPTPLQETSNILPSSNSTHKAITLTPEEQQQFEQLCDKIPSRLVENTLHISIRKLLSEEVEPSGAKRAAQNLMELHKLGKIQLNAEQQNVTQSIIQLSEEVEQIKEHHSNIALHKIILDRLLPLLPKHGTLKLEAGRYFLKGEGSATNERTLALTKIDISQAWDQLYQGYQDNPRDYGLLSYLGFIILMQGPKYLSVAEEFFNLFAKLIDHELSDGKYGVRDVKTPQKEMVRVAVKDHYILQAYQYYEQYRDNAYNFANFAKVLARAELSGSLDFYRRSMDGLTKIGRYDLRNLYEKILGETWVALLCRSPQSLGSIPLPFGEISLDMIVNVYKKIRRWWKYSGLKAEKIRPAIATLLKQMGKMQH